VASRRIGMAGTGNLHRSLKLLVRLQAFDVVVQSAVQFSSLSHRSEGCNRTPHQVLCCESMVVEPSCIDCGASVCRVSRYRTWRARLCRLIITYVRLCSNVGDNCTSRNSRIESGRLVAQSLDSAMGGQRTIACCMGACPRAYAYTA
jgi:hypothetical protein